MPAFYVDSNIRLLIFDCDGTLVDTLKAHYSAWNEAYQRHGKIFFTETEFNDKLFGISSNEAVEITNKLLNFNINPAQIIQLKNQIFFSTYAKNVQPKKEVIDIAKQYYGRLPMVVTSGAQADEVDMLLEATGIKSLFNDIITAADVKQGKPDPEIFLEASKRMHVQPEACFVFEDSAAGLEAARRARMRYIDINTL